MLREHGLLLPVEPDTRLLGETELWQLAFDVVSSYRGELRTDKSPATVTAMVLRLWSQLAEHLVDTEQLRDTHEELALLVNTLPAGPYQRERGPASGCCDCWPHRPSGPGWCPWSMRCTNGCSPKK
ncbi:superfamily protein I DNA and RNA helicase [Mycobacterium xenopi 3993]|nr:superfamily protein I DNA and RNA helicase [Mycobacterium xenopi 3993]